MHSMSDGREFRKIFRRRPALAVRMPCAERAVIATLLAVHPAGT